MRSRTLGLICPAVLMVTSGCVGPSAGREVNAAQQRTIGALAGSYAADLAMMRELLAANLRARRVVLMGGAHRQMLVRGYLTPELDADPERLHADIADASADSILVREVRLGRMSENDAGAFLNDYALTLRMKSEDAGREAMLARLAPIAAHDRAAATLMSSLDDHARGIAALFEDALANAHALSAFAAFEPDADGVSRRVVREVWERAIVDALDDPAKRDAAMRLLDRLLNNTPDTEPDDA